MILFQNMVVERLLQPLPTALTRNLGIIPDSVHVKDILIQFFLVKIADLVFHYLQVKIEGTYAVLC